MSRWFCKSSLGPLQLSEFWADGVKDKNDTGLASEPSRQDVELFRCQRGGTKPLAGVFYLTLIFNLFGEKVETEWSLARE